MKMKNLWMFLLVLAFAAGCSTNNQTQDDEAREEFVEVDDSLLEEEISDSDVVIEDTDEELLLDESEKPMDEVIASSEASEFQPAVAVQESSRPVEVNTSEFAYYTAQKGDTYMLMAWKIYGDYSKWREIAALNGGGAKVASGTRVKYYPPAEAFNWNPEGDPYLILNGDTLGRISNKVYGTEKKWRGIWNNNKPLIRDPNLIFAGFTIYYLADGNYAMN